MVRPYTAIDEGVPAGKILCFAIVLRAGFSGRRRCKNQYATSLWTVATSLRYDSAG